MKIVIIIATLIVSITAKNNLYSGDYYVETASNHQMIDSLIRNPEYLVKILADTSLSFKNEKDCSLFDKDLAENFKDYISDYYFMNFVIIEDRVSVSYLRDTVSTFENRIKIKSRKTAKIIKFIFLARIEFNSWKLSQIMFYEPSEQFKNDHIEVPGKKW